MLFRPACKTGDRIEVEVVQPTAGRALVIGKLDAVPEGAGRASHSRMAVMSGLQSAGLGRQGNGARGNGFLCQPTCRRRGDDDDSHVRMPQQNLPVASAPFILGICRSITI